MVDLTKDGRFLIAAILAGPVAWKSPAELSESTGLGLEDTADLMATLDEGGWLSAWERPDGVVVTLSTAAASRLEVRLVEVGPEESPRWAWRTEPDPPMPKARGVFRGGRVATLELVVDPRPGPVEAAERSEEAASRPATPAGTRGPSRPEAYPRPTILVGSGLSPWPGPGGGRKATCPACRSRRLGPSSYCLCCDRWGLDHILRGEPTPRPARDPAEDARKRDRERQARKEKRRACRTAQAQAERRDRRGPRTRPLDPPTPSPCRPQGPRPS